MNIKTILFCSLVIFISCKKANENTKVKKETIKKEEKTLSFEQFERTKWIVGDIGLNGEKPDTIIFNDSKTLHYISTDTGKELCKYSFVKDTLIFTSYSFEYKSNLKKEIKCKSVNKFHFENNYFKYIYFLNKCSNENRYKRINMESYNVKFRKL